MMEADGFVEQFKTLPRGNVFPHSRNLLLAGGLEAAFGPERMGYQGVDPEGAGRLA
jgi:hypothetical protein